MALLEGLGVLKKSNDLIEQSEGEVVPQTNKTNKLHGLSPRANSV
jgi:hypothetical protein